MIQLFIKHKLVAIFLAALPAGYSPFSPCERRMAPLSKQLTGVVLDHKFYGYHLDSQQRTIDEVLERKNFQHAGKRLGSIFGDMVNDGHKTVSSYVKPPQNRDQPRLSRGNQPEVVEAECVYKHVTASKYPLQIICWYDENCCRLHPILSNGFLLCFISQRMH